MHESVKMIRFLSEVRGGNYAFGFPLKLVLITTLQNPPSKPSQIPQSFHTNSPIFVTTHSRLLRTLSI